MRMNSHFSSVTLSYTPNSLSSFPHTNGPVPSPSQLFAALDWNWCLGSSNTSPWVQCPDLAAFAHTHKMHEKVEMLCWRAVSFPTIPTFIASRHLADKFSCLHNSLTPAVMQLIILKHKKEVCKGRNTCSFLILCIGCLLSQINSIHNSSPCTAVKFLKPNLATDPDTQHLFSVPWLNFGH